MTYELTLTCRIQELYREAMTSDDPESLTPLLEALIDLQAYRGEVFSNPPTKWEEFKWKLKRYTRHYNGKKK